MKPKFFETIYETMRKNDKVWLLTGDLGFGGVDKIQKDFPERFINCGASEQAMLGIAVGLAQEGKIPFVYTITPFFLRAMETINLYLHHEGAHVILVGAGRDDDYSKTDGYSHDAVVFQNLMDYLSIDKYTPDDGGVLPAMIGMAIKHKKPAFISLRR